jgi:GT2 family glycosyltransferase
MTEILPVSAVIATRNRPGPLSRTLESLARQSAQPAEIVVVDGSVDSATNELCGKPPAALESRITWQKATVLGAATQRNQAMPAASQDVIWFVDDDVLLEPECVTRLYAALQSDEEMGGASAMITNQRYQSPGRFTGSLYAALYGRPQVSYAGRCFGPGVNVLPEDRSDLPEVVPVDWLNTTCTMYRRQALPTPPFDSIFHGYSLCEDVTLSLRVAKRWRLANARTARIFHDTQPGEHKKSRVVLAEMELVNRCYLMQAVLDQSSIRDYTKLVIWEVFTLAAALAAGPRQFVEDAWGKLRGLSRLAFGSTV